MLGKFITGFVGILLSSVLDAAAFDYVESHNISERLSLRSQTYFIEDKNHEYTDEQVLNLFLKGEFQKAPESLQFGYRTSAIWLAVPIQNSSQSTQLPYLEIRYGPLDHIQVFHVDLSNPDVSQSIKMGDGVSFDSRPIRARNYLVPLMVEANAKTLLLLRVSSSSSLSIPLYLSDLESVYEYDHISQYMMGIFYGVSIGLLFYNLFLFFSTRSVIYFQYVMYIVGYSLFMASLDGLLFHLWPESTDWESRSLYFFAWGGFIFLVAFCRNLLRTKEESPISDLLLKILFYLFIIGTISIFLIDDVYVIGRLNAPSVMLTAMILLGIMIVRVLQGSKEASYTLVGMSCFYVGMLMVAGGTLNLHSYYELAPWVLKVGSAIEMILFSIALANKINTLEISSVKSKAEAQRHLENYEELYQNSIEGQFQLNDQGKVVKSNKSWKEIAGYQSEGEFQKSEGNFKDLFVDKKEFESLWERLQKRTRVNNFVAQLQSFNSSEIHNEIKMISLSIRQEMVSGNVSWVGSAIDVTESYRYEERLMQLQQEKNQSLKQLVMGVSHEMNTPLGNVKVAQSFLKETLQAAKVTPEESQAIESGMGIIEVGMSRLQELGTLIKRSIVSNWRYNWETINLSEWCEQWQESQRNLYPKLEIRLSILCEKEFWSTYSDALEKVLSQLTLNTVEHNQDLYEKEELFAVIEMSNQLSDGTDQLVICFSNNGEEIENEKRDAIFQPFYTTRRQQAKEKGLGLYVVYNLILEILNGQVSWTDKSDAINFSLTITLPEIKEDTRSNN